MRKIKNLKLFVLQQCYKECANIIFILQNHVDNLYLNNFIDFNQKNNLLNNIFMVSKDLNLLFNNYIIKKFDFDNLLDDKLKIFIDLFNNKINNNFIFNQIYDIIKKTDYNNLPLNELNNSILKLLSEIGYNNIVDLVNLYNTKFKLNDNQNKLINEISNIFIPVNICFYNVLNHSEDYYWRVLNKYNDIDVLELERELWIKNNDSDTEYLKINGYFINDSLSCFFKTSQIIYPVLQKKKIKLLNELNKTAIDSKFIKKFLRYDYLGNIYVLDNKSYIKHINNAYQKYNEVTNSSFVNIMKDFISNGSKIKKMYESIFLLLLGTSDNADIAGLLLGLTKEKKINNPVIYNLINQRLPYYLLIKIKKSNNSIKMELDKIKELTADIDYKKQLITSKNIPSSVRALTLEKIEEMKSFNNDYYKQLTFVKHILNYPWSSSSDDIFYKTINSDSEKCAIYLNQIEDKLKNLSYGHTEAKKNLLQTIGKWISNPSSQGTCFGLVGPPGVGKTLLAKSISSALDIPFGEITLGGQNDGEILHGHGYTYSGSQPGLIIKKMVEMGKSRCVLYFDELDKACSKHGSINEITSILIHLTDPNMNKTFQDRFFQGIDFPLDKIIMIFSYNDPNLVDPILLDRLKQIEVSAYTINEKIKIVKEFIIPEVAKSIGLQNEEWIHINEELIEWIIENYTNEAGVRSIKRKIEQIFLTLNLDKIHKKNYFINNNFNLITKDIVIGILDKPIYDNVIIHNKPAIGIISGLYATANGDGGIIPIQIFNHFSPNSTNYEIKLTGKQGDIMKESVHCSLTAAIDYIRRNIHKYPYIKNIDEHLYNNFKYGFHVHAPSTSTPKDGPSAGCAFTSAFISRILGKPIKNNIAMTGEVELTGKITKIGGLNFKLIGAKRAGVKLVYVPKENENDINEIKLKYPNLINDSFNVQLFEYIDEIIDDIILI
jgi:endopeptidase La